MSHCHLCASLHLSWDSGDLASFARPRDLLAQLHDALFAETNPVPLKAALAMPNLTTQMGIASTKLPAPGLISLAYRNRRIAGAGRAGEKTRGRRECYGRSAARRRSAFRPIFSAFPAGTGH